MATTGAYLPETSPATAKGAPAAARPETGTGAVAAIGLSHNVNDTYAAFLSPLLPAFIANLTLTKADAGLLTVFFQGPSLLQPVIGHMSDSRNLRWLLVIAPAITGAMMCLLGIAPTYGILAFLLLLAGLSSAGMHAVGAPMMGDLAGRRLGRGMSIWMVCGETGYAIGPVVAVTAVSALTLRGLPWLMVGGFATSVAVFWLLRRLPARAPRHTGSQPVWPALRAMRPVLIPISVIVILRAFLESATSTYLPTLLTGEGASLWVGGISVSILEIAALGGIALAGSWSDRRGRRQVLALSCLIAPIAMFLFLGAGGPVRAAWLILVGFALFAGTPVIMAIVQGGFPENRALASGIYMAVAFALRSGVTVLVGVLADRFGMRPAFYMSSAVALLALPALLLLPKVERSVVS
jgi:MFS transporter, FSR family, fosmidomycin resistance protein